jgi:hypothetical protein
MKSGGLFGAEMHSNNVTSPNEVDECPGEWLSSTPNAEGDKVETESIPPTVRTYQFDHEIDNPNHFT